MESIISNGALFDSRTSVQREKDYSVHELPAAAAIVTFQNPKPTSLSATVFNQWYVGSCVPHGFYTQLEYEGLLPPGGMSQLRVYRKRANYPQAGSIGVDVYDKIRAGQSINADFPTPDGFTEAQATAMQLIVGDKLIKDFNYFQYVDAQGKLTPELVPPDIAAGKAVAIFIYATEGEWAQQYVEVKTQNLDPNTAYVRHCICIIPKGDFTENGKQWLAVHDSAKFAGIHLRYITYDFLLKRAYFASKVYPKASVPVPTPPPAPSKKPTAVCQYGDSGAPVTALQAFLAAEGKLDKKYITGYYGAITAKAVLWWQLEHWDKFAEKYKDTTIPALLELAGKYWGPQSVAIIS